MKKERMEKSAYSRPLKASDLKGAYSGPRDLKAIAITKDVIRLSGDGIFYTLQGEGPTLGYPAVFVRLHHCNLACSFCDAFYTWDKSSKEFWTESKPWDFDELADAIDSMWPVTAKEARVVWTGGEPLMQKNQIDQVMQFMWREFDGFWHPEVETNGTIMPTELQLRNFQFNVSPKSSNSDNPLRKRIKPKVLQALNKANSSFKFVCRDEADIKELLVDYSPYIDVEKIVIMPEGVTEDEITPHARALAPICKDYALRMTPRFQAIAFDGAARGV